LENDDRKTGTANNKWQLITTLRSHAGTKTDINTLSPYFGFELAFPEIDLSKLKVALTFGLDGDTDEEVDSSILSSETLSGNDSGTLMHKNPRVLAFYCWVNDRTCNIKFTLKPTVSDNSVYNKLVDRTDFRAADKRLSVFLIFSSPCSLFDKNSLSFSYI
jgi:hypothetical protein